jgi:hypothetical protein
MEYVNGACKLVLLIDEGRNLNWGKICYHERSRQEYFLFGDYVHGLGRVWSSENAIS